MKPEQNNHAAEELSEAVKLREQRARSWQEEGERPLWKNLSMVGALGWLIVIPTLIGIALGRWLDQTLGTGILFTGAMIFLGICTGGALAWHRIHEE